MAALRNSPLAPARRSHVFGGSGESDASLAGESPSVLVSVLLVVVSFFCLILSSGRTKSQGTPSSMIEFPVIPLVPVPSSLLQRAYSHSSLHLLVAHRVRRAPLLRKSALFWLSLNF